MSAKDAKQNEPKLEEVELLKPHEHGGEQHPAGAKILVNAPDKAFLIEHEIIAAPAA